MDKTTETPTTGQEQNADPLGSSAATGYGAWVSVAAKLPPFNKQVLVINDGHRLCAILQNVTRSIAKDAPKDKRWYAVPGWGHELNNVTMWCDLPEAP